jgi:hypothetical protein
MKFFASMLACIFGAFLLSAQSVTIPTHRYNNYRSGWNDRETQLSPATVDSAQFGMLFTLPVDDQMFAQPLLVSGLKVRGFKYNVLFAATVNNSIYAFDAEGTVERPLWHVNLTHPGARPIRNSDMTEACDGNYQDFSGKMGIVGTPVIDTNTFTLYVVAREIDTSGRYYQYLHALDIRSGYEKPGSPVFITATAAGFGDGNEGGIITFDQQKQNQRPALLLHQGVVYICWASHCDWSPYHGWLIGYDAATLQRVRVYNSTPDGGDGGIWMSANGPTVDEKGFIYLATGNGTVGRDNDNDTPDLANDTRDRGESLLKMIPSGDSMHIVDFFTPANYPFMEENDLDYGVDGVTLIPNTTLSLSGSKEGKLYLVDVEHMGKYTPGNEGAKQVLIVNYQQTAENNMHGSPLYYRYTVNGVDSEYVYAWAESDSLRQFLFDRSHMNFDIDHSITGDIKLDNGLPGGIMVASSNGTQPGTGIIWAIHPLSGNANNETRPGRLEAFDARNVHKRLWESEQNPARDAVGGLAKFNVPVVANGKVYLATFSNRIDVYGSLNVINHSPVAGAYPIAFHRMYPNPAREAIKVEYGLSDYVSDLTFVVTDIYGSVLSETPLPVNPGKHTCQINLDDTWSAGVYLTWFTGYNLKVSGGKLIKL